MAGAMGFFCQALRCFSRPVGDGLEDLRCGGLGFWVLGGFRMWDLGFKVWGVRFRVLGV